MGFYRTPQPLALDRAAVTAVVIQFVANEAAFENRTLDPFHIEPGCVSTSGHHFIASCGEVVCSHCARIAWR